MAKIYIIDVTNRDGVQTANIGLAKLEKTMLNLFLDEMGIFQSEFGFPTLKHEANYLNANLDLVKGSVLKQIRLSGWLRALPADVELAYRLVPNLEHINISTPTSDQMVKTKFQGKVKREDIIKEVKNTLDTAYAHGAKTVAVNAEDASRTDLNFLLEFAKAAKEHKAVRIRYCDTLGYDDPFTIYNTIKTLAENVKIPIEVHCHNDLGMGVAISLTGAKGAIDAGVDAYINTTVNGVGERTGNADLLSVLLAIKYSKGFAGKYKLAGNIDLTKIWKLAKYASTAFRVPISVNQVGVGDNAFAHEAGIHADGALKDRKNYELYDYEELGRGEKEHIETGRIITTGEYGGIKGFLHVFNQLGAEFDNEEEAKKVLELVKYANAHTQKPLTKEELLFIKNNPEISRKILTITP